MNNISEERIYEKVHKYCACTSFDNFSVSYDLTVGAGNRCDPLSGATQIANLNLSSGAVVTPDALASGVNICVGAKQNTAFTENGMADYAAYFRTTAEGMTVVADSNGALPVMPPAALADGDGLSTVSPIYLRNESDWYTYLRSTSGIVYKNRNTRKVYYFKVMANIVLDAATGEDTVAGACSNIEGAAKSVFLQ